MARVYEEIVVVKLSKLVKDDAKDSKLLDDGVETALESVIAELVGDEAVIVEVTRD